MAEIGIMKKLTIGGSTYTIPEYNLPIASASTLGGVKIGTGLSINSTTGVLSATGLDYDEADPIFTASAAYGITSSDISNWNSKTSNTGTVTKVTAGTGLSIGSTSGGNFTTSGTINHTNSVTAQTTQAVYPIKIDAQGHISGYGSAVTISDTKVTQNYSTASGGHPILMTPEANISSTSSRGDTTAILTNAIYATPSTGNLQATTFNGYTLAAASAKAVDTSISAASTSTNLPTSAAVASFVEGKGYITSADVPEGASAYTGTISAVGTTASNGTNNGFARGDHVHNITSATIISALGYTPYNSTNPNGYISSYTDENMKWTASTSSNTYYPLQSTSTATTSTANTLNSVSFYQYYNTAGGYRRLILGNSTAYTSTGGAYGTIRLYGAAATYYGDLVPGVLSTSSTGRLTANRTWTLPDKTGTVALTSDIPSVPTSAASATTGITASTTANTTSVSGSDSFSATVTSHVLSFSHSAKTVSTSSATVTITDNGHTHTLS